MKIQIRILDEHHVCLSSAEVSIAYWSANEDEAAYYLAKPISVEFDAESELFWTNVDHFGTYKITANHKGYFSNSTVYDVRGRKEVFEMVLLPTAGRFLLIGNQPFALPEAETIMVRKSGRENIVFDALVVNLEKKYGVSGLWRLDIDDANLQFWTLDLPTTLSLSDTDQLKGDLLDAGFELSGWLVNEGTVGRSGGDDLDAEGQETDFIISDLVFVSFGEEMEPNRLAGLLDPGFWKIVESDRIDYYQCYLRYLGSYSELPEKFAVLRGQAWVKECEIVSIVIPEEFIITPTNYLFPEQWTFPVANVTDAWQSLHDINPSLTLGSADVVISVYDTGVVTNALPGGIPAAYPSPLINPVHPDFNGTLQGGNVTGILPLLPGAIPDNRKGYWFFNFSAMTPVITAPVGATSPHHGTACAGVAVALGDDPDGFPGADGVAGVAANSRLIGIAWPNGLPTVYWDESFQWLSGLNTNWTVASYPVGTFFPPRFGIAANPGPPAAIASNSWGRGGVLVVIPVTTDRTIDQITSFGNLRKGTFVVFAAGNADNILLTNPQINIYAHHEKVVAVAACSLDLNGEEVRSSYSKFGNNVVIGPGAGTPGQIFDNGIDFCAPSHHNYVVFPPPPVVVPPIPALTGIDHNPPINYGVMSSFLNGQGNLPWLGGGPLVLAAATVLGSYTITLVAVGGLAANNAIIIGAPGSVNAEGFRVISIGAGGVVTLGGPIQQNHPIGTLVFFGASDNVYRFGGTSASCPFTAGVAALIWSAKSNLTYAEVRDILRRTAMPIDLRLGTLTVGGVNLGWVDVNNAPILDGNFLLAPPILPLPVTNTTLSVVAPVAGAIQITVASKAGFSVGQAILVGAETILTGIVSPTVISVANASDFIVGEKVYIGHGPRAFTSRPTVPGAGLVRVSNTRGFLAGQQIQIGANLFTIGAITNSTTITFVLPQVIPAVADPMYTPVTLANEELIEIDAVNVGLNRITLHTALANAHPLAPRVWVMQEKTEIRVIRGLGVDGLGNDVITIDALRYGHIIGTHVKGGLIPYYSNGLGFGRIDAKAAVDAALAYDHNWRDLMIRKHKADTGIYQGYAGDIDSPDIWVRNDGLPSPPVIDPLDPMDPWGGIGSHQNPRRDIARTVHVRYANRGSALPSLDHSVHLYLCLKVDGVPITLADYQQTPGYLASTSTPGTEAIGLAQEGIYNGVQMPAMQGVANYNQVQFTWNQNIMPDLSTLPANLKPYLLVEITPHDGPDNLNANVSRNNNLTYKPIDFSHDVRFLDGTGAVELQPSVGADPAGATSTVNFRIQVKDFVNFTTEAIQIQVIRRHINPPSDLTQTYTFGPAWALGDPLQTWLVINAPLLPPGGVGALPAAGLQTDVSFNGSFDVDYNHIGVEFQVTVPGTQPVFGAFNSVKTYKVVVFAQLPYNETFSIVPSNKPRLHTFTQMNLLDKQLVEDAFGPDAVPGGGGPNPTQIFRITSSFQASLATLGGPTPVPAYAAVSGFVFVQVDDLDPVNKVNLFLKPLRQSKIGFTPVKYFVYRGLQLNQFLDTVTPFEAVPFATATNFMLDVWNTYIQVQLEQGNPTPVTMPSKVIGWDAAQTGADLVDQYFFTSNADAQLPIATMGQYLGDFYVAGGSKIGFEIILEEGFYQPTLAFARQTEAKIDVTALVPNSLQERAKREEILNFIDPAAYYAMHYFIGVETPDVPTSIKTGNDLYVWAVQQFATSNTRYVDVRNENGYSYNYYQNYTSFAGVSGPGNVQTGLADLTLTTENYGTYQWPILILPETSFLTTTGTTPLRIQLKVDDNLKPLIYAASGELKGETKVNDRFIEPSDLLSGLPWTNSIVFDSPNVVYTPNPAMQTPVCDWIKLHYFRRGAVNPLSPSSVVKIGSYLDSAFGPLDVPDILQPNSLDDIEWLNAQDISFIDGQDPDPEENFAYVAERGVAHEPDRVIYYAAAKDYLEKRTKKKAHLVNGLTSGISTRGNFFEILNVFQGVDVKIKNISPGNPPNSTNWIQVKLLEFVPKKEVLPESFLVLGITEAEHTTLMAIGGYSPYHMRTIRLVEVMPTSGSTLRDKHLKAYRAFEVKVHCWDAGGNEDTLDPVAPIYVYTLDGYVFGSAAFGDLQPIAATYEPTTEEGRTVRFDADVDEMIQLDPDMVAAVNNFAAAVSGVTNDENAKPNLEGLAMSFGLDLWNDATNFVQTGPLQDGRPLYWARLKMLVLLKSHPYCLDFPDEGKAIAKIFEDFSRGYESLADFGAAPGLAKKIVLLGFDPYGLEAEVKSHNPSSSTSLLFDNSTLSFLGTNCHVRTAIIPTRYDDFDGNLLETLLQGFFDTSTVNAVISISQNGSSNYYDLERFGGRYRRGSEDNNGGKRGSGPIGAGNFAEFYETDLPVTNMVPGPFPGSPGQVRYFNESYVSSGGPNRLHPSTPTVPNSNLPSFLIGVISGTAVEGSGGNYLSNECTYRIMRMRNITAGTTVKAGHLHIPGPDVDIDGNPTLATILNMVQTILENGIPGY